MCSVLTVSQGASVETSRAALPLKKRKDPVNVKPHPALNARSEVPDPVGKRTRVRTILERRSKRPFLLARALLKKTKREKLRLEKQKSLGSQNRMKEAYDLWAGEEVPPKEEEVEIPLARKPPKRPPSTMQKPKSVVPAVEVPHAGMSYNPSLEDHQVLVQDAVKAEMKKLVKEAKIEARFRRYLPNAKDAPTEEDQWLAQAQGLFGGTEERMEKEEGQTCRKRKSSGLEEAEEEVPRKKSVRFKESEGEEEEEEFYQPRAVEAKTRKKRRKEREERKKQKEKEEEKLGKRKQAEVFRVRSHLKEISAKEAAQKKLREAKKRRREKVALRRPLTLSRHRCLPSDLPVKTSDELSGTLKDLVPEGTLLEERFKSLQRRNLIESRVKTKPAKVKVKKFFKRDHRLWMEEKLAATTSTST
ncbi:unnamed protein product [Cyprideis torosa]|uniref:Ribosome biogenesis protein NOP53 n=1 Tax=Cyprideis torosa TaxID=163714 RepID=A0A7R8WVR8_9CRUS|nr:unnamed protein product [Cyprideis torosa]CAG0906796.1 unnamed protein product [Cyprideis torosa]